MDTDVVAAALLGEPTAGEESGRVLASRFELTAPAFWMAELTSVLWKAVLRGDVTPEHATDLLSLAGSLPIASVDASTLWQGALARAIAHHHPAYDTFLVELAVRLGTQVVSYDSKLQRAFPDVVIPPRRLVRG